MQFFESAERAAPEFCSHIEQNTKRYIQLFAAVADSLMPEATSHDIEPDVFDVLAQHVRHRMGLGRQKRKTKCLRSQSG